MATESFEKAFIVYNKEVITKFKNTLKNPKKIKILGIDVLIEDKEKIKFLLEKFKK